MQAVAVVMWQPGQIVVEPLELAEPAAHDLVVAVDWTGISTGTERLLWQGRMPEFPGLGYPLVPGYEAVGRVTATGPGSAFSLGDSVFVPGCRGFTQVRGLFGASAGTLVVPEARAVLLPRAGAPDDTLLALAATAHHILASGTELPELIVGHGVLGRLLARMIVARGGTPVVWESNKARRGDAVGYSVTTSADDPRRDYRSICDVSGDGKLLDSLIARVAPGGEVVLAGFYGADLTFRFPPAFMREVRIRVAAEFKSADLIAVRDAIAAGTLDLAGLVTHQAAATDAADAYPNAFDDSSCLKMVLDWRHVS